jgi:dihydrofolate reductase
MRKVIVSNLVSLDGYMAGPNGDIDWFMDIADEEFENYSAELINSIDIMLFGRVTYQLMEAYWPTASPDTNDVRIIHAMNHCRKLVFSKTLEEVTWTNSQLMNGEPAAVVSKLKQEEGKDLVVYGSGALVSTLTQAGLIDDYRILVVPIVLGSGKPLFGPAISQFDLKLQEASTFRSGLVLLHYVRSEN